MTLTDALADSPAARSRRHAQMTSGGRADADLHGRVLAACLPAPGLRWLDVGCGNGAMLRAVDRLHRPAALQATDLIDWVGADLHGRVDLRVGPAEETLSACAVADRVLMIEVLEHLEAPWTVLRLAARRVAPGGRMVLSTPNLASARHRMELLLRGQLTSFRPDNVAHLQPVLGHVVTRMLTEEGLVVEPGYAGTDIIPGTRGRRWPPGPATRWPGLLSTSSVFVARRVSSNLNRRVKV